MRKHYAHVTSINRPHTDARNAALDEEEKPLDKSSVVSSIIGMVCICIYIGIMVFAVIRIYVSVIERQNTAKLEFFDLVQTATNVITSTSNPTVTLASDSFKTSIRDFLIESKTLEGIIVSGPYSDFHIEREPGAAVTWKGDTPRFKSTFGLSRPEDAFFEQIQVPNLRNVTISVAYGFLDREGITPVLTHALFVILGTTIFAGLTMFLQFLLATRKKKVQVETFSDIIEGKYRTDEEAEDSDDADADYEEPVVPNVPLEAMQPEQSTSSIRDTDIDDEFFNSAITELPQFDEQVPLPDPERQSKPAPTFAQPIPVVPPPAMPMPAVQAPAAQAPAAPVGRQERPAPGRLCWESDTEERLNAALRECATSEKDLTVIAMDLKDPSGIATSNALYQTLVEETLTYFIFQDRLFERGPRGASVILPGIDLNGGFTKAGEFHKRVSDKLAGKAKLYIGLSAQSGRAVNAERLLLEAAGALEKAAEDPISPIVAFRSDPKKYKDFIASQNKTHP